MEVCHKATWGEPASQIGCQFIENTLLVTHFIPIFDIIPLLNPLTPFLRHCFSSPYKGNFTYFKEPPACKQITKKQPIFHKNNITQPVSQHHNTVARKNAITHFPFKWLSSQDRPIHSGARDAPNSSKTSQGNTWTIYGELFTQHFGLNSIYVYQFWWELENFLEFLLNFRIF